MKKTITIMSCLLLLVACTPFGVTKVNLRKAFRQKTAAKDLYSRVDICPLRLPTAVALPEDPRMDVTDNLVFLPDSSPTRTLSLPTEGVTLNRMQRRDDAALDQGRINSVQMLKDEAAFKKYGDKAAHGVIVVNLKAPMEMDEVVVVSYRDESELELVPFRLIPDKMPSFQGGGLNEFSRWLSRRIDVPKDCAHAGRMKVSFEVFADGTVGDVEVTESVCPELDALVTNLIKQSPKWEPGTTREGKPISAPGIFFVVWGFDSRSGGFRLGFPPACRYFCTKEFSRYV